MKKNSIGLTETLLNNSDESQALKTHPYFSKILAKYFDLNSFGLSFQDHLLVSTDTLPKNDYLSANEHNYQAQDELENICGYIINESVSNTEYTRFDSFNSSYNTNLAASQSALQFLQKYPLIPVEDAQRLLSDYQIRRNFFERVFVVTRWKKLIEKGLTAERLLKFHAQHKLIIMSHGDYRDLGHLLTELSKDRIELIAKQYIKQLLITLLGVVSRSSHVNVLQHIQGYLKKDLSPDDKAELSESIELFLKGEVLLMVPLALLNHHFRKYPNAYIQEAYYMQSFPLDLVLLDQNLI